MDKSLRLACLILFGAALAQVRVADEQLPILPGVLQPAAGSSTGTFTIYNAPSSNNCAISSGATTCSITASNAPLAGDLDVFRCYIPNGTITYLATDISSVNISGTLVTAVGSSLGGEGNSSGTNTARSVAYILPSTSGSHSTSVVITLNQAASSGGGSCTFLEATPSAYGSLVGLDIDNTYIPSSACTSCSDISVTQSASNDVCEIGFMGLSGYTAPSAVASPYNTDAYLPGSGNGVGMSSAITSNINSAWMTSSVTPVLGGTCYGWNASAGSQQTIATFGTGTSGSTVTVANLMSATSGLQPGVWQLNGTITWQSAASMPFQNSTGRLWGDGVNHSDSDALGVAWTGTGSGAYDELVYNFGYTNLSKLSAGIWFCATTTAANTFNTDLFAIHATSSSGADDFVNIKFEGNGTNLFFQQETASGTGDSDSFNYTPTDSSCDVPGDWYQIQEQYVSGNGSTGGALTINFYNTSGTLLKSMTDGLSTSAVTTANRILLFSTSSQTLPSGQAEYLDSLKIDYTGATLPLIQ